VAYPFFRERVGPLFLLSFSWVPHPCVFLGCGVFFASAPQEAGASAPAQTTPKTILPPIPFSALTHAPVISTGMNDSSRFSLRGYPAARFLKP
jgi:hypothetical protein